MISYENLSHTQKTMCTHWDTAADTVSPASQGGHKFGANRSLVSSCAAMTIFGVFRAFLFEYLLQA